MDKNSRENKFKDYFFDTKACPTYLKLKYQQAKRRQEALDLQRQKRDNQVNERRQLKIDSDSTEYQTNDPNFEAYELAMSMMHSEWMFEKPEDIEDWIAVLCPKGKRFCVIVQDNKTKAVDKYGTSFNLFSSLFPNGCYLSSVSSSHRKRIILDCLYSFKLKKYYILDIIEWMGIPYTDFPAEFRFYFIQSKLNEIPGINEKSVKNTFPFELAPRMPTSELYPQLLENCEFFPKGIELDGINFYNPEGMYTTGESPLVLWLKVFMIPEILYMPINDQLAQSRPSDYVNIFEYSQNMKKKTRKYKKKNTVSSSHSDTMEVDTFIEMEPGTEDPVVKLDKTANAMYVED